MTDWDDQVAEDDGVLSPSDSLLTDRLEDDPLDTGVITADGYRGATAYGTTAEEGHTGESLEQLLAAEEPDTDPDAVDDRWLDGPSPRAGRLVHGDGTAGFDLGRDAGAASAEEAAVHLTDEDQDEAAVYGDATEDESLREAIGFSILDDQADAAHDDYR
jgi:hypothetical protein